MWGRLELSQAQSRPSRVARGLHQARKRRAPSPNGPGAPDARPPGPQFLVCKSGEEALARGELRSCRKEGLRLGLDDRSHSADTPARTCSPAAARPHSPGPAVCGSFS